MITGSTRCAAVIGDPVRHSRSPQIHNAAFAALDLDWVYLALPVPAGQGAAAVDAMRVLGLDGLNVTMPHKEVVAGAVDRCTPAAAALGAVNCVFRDGEDLVGDNTDGVGFVRALEADSGTSIVGASIVVFGAGAAARAVIDAAARRGAERVMVVNRTRSSAERAADLHPAALVGSPDDVLNADVIVNATSVGMDGGPAPCSAPFDVDLIRSHHIVADVVYSPAVTTLLAAAADRGATCVNGLGMLVHQAAISFEHWTGRAAPLDVMRAAASDL